MLGAVQEASVVGVAHGARERADARCPCQRRPSGCPASDLWKWKRGCGILTDVRGDPKALVRAPRAWHCERVSTALTQGIRVTVSTVYVPSQSAPTSHRYVFAYTIRIANEGAA